MREARALGSRQRGGLKCPKCGSAKVRRILYGLPNEEVIEAGRRGEVELGGLLHSWERSFVGMRRMWKQLVMALNFPVRAPERKSLTEAAG